MGLDPNSRVRFNLSKAAILLLDPSAMGMSISAQILSGFGAKHFYRCSTIAEGKEMVSTFEIDLMIVDSMSQAGEGYDFVRWVRTEAAQPNAYAPVLLTAGHIRVPDVKKARDCGAHFLVARPIAPVVMLERIIWVSKEERGFLLTDGYVGPDRRFRDDGPPGGQEGRRREDKLRALATSAGEAPEDPSRDEAERVEN